MSNEISSNKSQGLIKSASLIVVVILLSKIAGFLRDVIVANYYGASLVSDAYFYAYQIPALAIVILTGLKTCYIRLILAFAQRTSQLKEL